MNRSDYDQKVNGDSNLLFKFDPTDLIAKDIHYEGLPNSKVAKSIQSILGYSRQGDDDIIQTDHTDFKLIMTRK